jgi:hypothetical protein
MSKNSEKWKVKSQALPPDAKASGYRNAGSPINGAENLRYRPNKPWFFNFLSVFSVFSVVQNLSSVPLFLCASALGFFSPFLLSFASLRPSRLCVDSFNRFSSLRFSLFRVASLPLLRTQNSELFLRLCVNSFSFSSLKDLR